MRVTSRLATLTFVLAAAAPLSALSAQTLDAAADTGAVVAAPAAPAAQPTIPTTVTAADLTAPLPAVQQQARVAGASMTGLRAGVHTRESNAPLSANAAHANLGQDRALMIAGAAALVVGAIIGGDSGTIIMVGGAVVGLYGLYQYLQ